jgi:hypothetical protein
MTIESEEHYGDLPAGGGGNVGGFIGLVAVRRRWLLGWNPEDRELDGLGKVSKGFSYYKGSLDDARKLAKEHFDAQYDPKLVLVFTMPPSSFKNMTEENKAKFVSGPISTHSVVVGTESKYGAALNLVTVPSMINAYALDKGWIKESLIDLGQLRNIEETEDTTDVLTTLNEQRAALWAALGEPDPLKTYREKAGDKKGTTAPKLREALAKTVGDAWDGWVKLGQVFDPSEGAWNKSKSKRFKIPAILAIYAGEKSAIDAGAKELAERAERSGESATSEAPTADYAAMFEKLSAKAKKTYDLDTWVQCAPVFVGEVQASGGKSIKTPAIIKIASSNELDKADVELLVATF